MPDLLASAAVITLGSPLSARAKPVALPGAAGFDLALALLPPGATGKTGAATPAGSGKDLPVADAAADEDTDPDALLAWLPGALPPLPTQTPPPGPALAPPQPAATEPALAASPAAPIDPALAGTGDAATADSSDLNPLRTWRDPVPANAEPVARGGVAAMEGQNRPPIAAPDPTAPIALAAIPAPATPATPATPAAQAFAAALAASHTAATAPETSQPARATDPTGLELQSLRTAELARTTVQATAQADQAPLDLSRDDWTGKMIDRIAALRDGVEAADTRIRLAPEHLGTVDIALRRDGDRIHVQFSAENPATRQMLTDAAPRLAELAEARGVKLGQSSVDGGTGGQRQSPQQQPSTPARPASARATGEPASDARVA